jgi:hypothetical protein
MQLSRAIVASNLTRPHWHEPACLWGLLIKVSSMRIGENVGFSKYGKSLADVQN